MQPVENQGPKQILPVDFTLHNAAQCGTLRTVKTTPNPHHTAPTYTNLRERGHKCYQLNGIWYCKFRFEGRVYKLYRREPTTSAVWYTAFAVRGRRIHRSLGTNSAAAAVELAIRHHIQPAKAGRWEALDQTRARQEFSTLQDVFIVYDQIALLSDRSRKNNKLALLKMIEWAEGRRLEPADIRLSLISRGLVQRYQAAMVAHYTRQAAGDRESQRQARDLALRTSRSTFQQAKSIFSGHRDLIGQYRERGLIIPDSVIEFDAFRPLGKIARDIYYPPDDAIIRATFHAAETELREHQPDAYLLFWLCLGTGMRRGEAAETRWEHFVERGGRLWVSGGTGKDGKRIEIPVIDKLLLDYSATSPLALLQSIRRTGGFVLPGDRRMRHDTIPSRLNCWLEAKGWRDQKKLHALRAFIGSQIWERDPRTAQFYLRHKSITTTEQFYSHFARFTAAAETL